MLGVGDDASRDAARRAYLDLARQHHPDRFVGSSAEAKAAADRRMREVNEAWAAIQASGGGGVVSAAPRPTAPPRAPTYSHRAEQNHGYEVGESETGPWLMWGLWPLAAIIGVLGLIFVVTAFITVSNVDGGGATADGAGGAGAASEAQPVGATPVLAGPREATPNQAAVIGQCVKVLDDVVIDSMACTPDADGVVEPALDATGRCSGGRNPVYHPDIGLRVCVRPMGG